MFHDKYMRVIKKIQAYFEDYHLRSKAKWLVINRFPLHNHENPTKKVSIMFFFHFLTQDFFSLPF
jgi:hypothetical protein